MDTTRSVNPESVGLPFNTIMDISPISNSLCTKNFRDHGNCVLEIDNDKLSSHVNSDAKGSIIEGIESHDISINISESDCSYEENLGSYHISLDDIQNCSYDNAMIYNESIPQNTDCNTRQFSDGANAPIDMEIFKTAEEELNDLKINNSNRIIIGHININSIRNKFDDLQHIVRDKIDILLVSETKIDNSFPDGQFSIDGYSKPYRHDRNAFGGGLVAYFREDIPCRELKVHNIPGDIEGTFIEINLRKKKWLLFFGYNPNKGNISNFLENVMYAMDKYLESYDNILVIGDFNSELSKDPMKRFCESYNLKNLIKSPTCYKNPLSPTCIDLILTNRYNSFQNSITVETGLSDFHKMTVTVLKTYFQKKGPIFIKYRNYNFDETLFRNELSQEMGNICFEGKSPDYDTFHHAFMTVLDKYAPTKEKKVRANNAPFMNKALSKAIMTRSRLRNRYNKTPTYENLVAYKKQRNFCVKLSRKTKRDYYNNIKINNVTDNKTFWRTIKPLFSDKQNVRQHITLIEGDNIISNDKDVADKMNDFFINVVTNLEIEDPFTDDDSNCEGIAKCLNKFQNHPSIIKIKEEYKITEKFSFNTVGTKDIELIINGLNKKSATVYNDIHAKFLQKQKVILPPLLLQKYMKL